MPMRFSVLHRSSMFKNFFHFFLTAFDQRAVAALLAIVFRSSAESFAARALPPFNPPSLPSATAAAFFFRCLPFAIRELSQFTRRVESPLFIQEGNKRAREAASSPDL